MTTDKLYNELTLIEEAYLALLRLSTGDRFRLANQDIYARLRDEIASDWQWDSERIQDHFEGLAHDLQNKHTLLAIDTNSGVAVYDDAVYAPTKNTVADCIYNNEDCPVCPTKT